MNNVFELNKDKDVIESQDALTTKEKQKDTSDNTTWIEEQDLNFIQISELSAIKSSTALQNKSSADTLSLSTSLSHIVFII